MTPKVLRWLFFSILFSLLPLAIDYLLVSGRYVGPGLASLREVIGRGELCLISAALTAVGAGEIFGAAVRDERVGILLGGFSFLNGALAIALYVMMKSAEDNAPGMYIIASCIIFVSTLIVATSCISASEVKRG